MICCSRRRFLTVSLGAGAALSAWAAWRFGSPSTEADPLTIEPSTDRRFRAVRHGLALGTTVSIAARHQQREVLKDALAGAFDELRLIESLMSIYRDDSQLRVLNRDGVLEDPHPHVVKVLRQAAEISRLSNGAFDITVQPLWTAHAAGTTPDPSALKLALSRVDWRGVVIGERRVRLRKPGMEITFNGIAQGFAADQVRAVLARHGVEDALVNAGEITSLGEREDGAAWRIGVQHPREEDAYIGLVDLDDRGLATSGDYATSFTEDRRRHHLFDPRTGLSPGAFRSVSVAAPSTMLADALSTAVFVMAPDEGIDLIRGLDGVDGMFVFGDGRVSATDGFPRV